MLWFDTALGRCGVSWSETGITDVLLPEEGQPRRRDDVASLGEPPEFVHTAVDGMVAVLDGARRDLREVQLDQRGVDRFRRKVYAAARAIDPGASASYGEIARSIGEPGAARAVGVALGRNPYPIIVPCHRVIGADGALTGFSAPGGITTKRRMLEIENAPGFCQIALFACT
jgi:methylated-DNA-[protein]-cysteine S-methyltransferase